MAIKSGIRQMLMSTTHAATAKQKAVGQVIPELKGIITCTGDRVVSSDLTGFPETCIFDETAGIMLDDDFVKLIAWYDNEWGYTNKLLDLITYMHSVDTQG